MKKNLNKTNEQLSFELNDLRKKSKEREKMQEAANQQLLATEQQLRNSNHQLLERIKELNCFYGISRIVEISDISLEEIFRRIVKLIPVSWQYPEIAVCRIIFDGIEYKTHKFEKTKWSQCSDIIINGKPIGSVEVCYLKKMPDSDEGAFLKEEKFLLDALAERLGKITERKQAEDKVRAANQQLEAANQQLLATEQQLRAANQQLEANNQQLIATEQQLRASEDRLSKTLIAANDGMWDWNLTTNKVYFDPRYYEMAGYAIDEFPYEFDEFKKRIHPDDVENVMTHAQQHLAGKTDRFRVEFRFKKKNGDWLWVLGRGLIVERNKNNKPLRFIGTHSDITERKQVEEALKESEEKFRLLFSEMTEGVYLHEIIYNKKGKAIDYRIIETNPASEKYLHIKPEDAIGKLATDLYGTNEAPFLDIYARVAETCKGVEFEEYFSPMKKYFHISVYCPEKGKFATIFTDITERKQAEEALKESEEKYRTFINTASDLMCITDEEGKFTEVNESMINKLEYSGNELIGNHFRIILTKKSIEKDLLPNWDKFVKNGKISIETTFLSKKGNELYCELKSIGIYDDNNKFIGSRAVIHDLTQHKWADEALKKRMNELEIFNEAAVGRELKIIELKKEINELLVKTGQKPKYEIIV